ncbi:ABC transporter ATP-binding protein [Curtobacterium flaccumfaciens]|nr:ABC transporter ATP-binding protein [Curtobacterium flaccumfaciens]
MLAKLESTTRGSIDVRLEDGTPSSAACTGGTCRWCSRTRSRRSTRSTPSSTTSPGRCSSTTVRAAPRRPPSGSANCSAASTSTRTSPRVGRTSFSGGQRQRAAIARALAPGAQVLVADEPVSMLDVSIRLSVLNLMGRLQREDHLAVLYITHDLATARHFSDEILVLYRGRVVERGPSDAVILNPQHDYTRLLAEAAPDPERTDRRVTSGSALDRSKIDNTTCYDHAVGDWVTSSPAPVGAR